MLETALNESYLGQVRAVSKANNDEKLCAFDQTNFSNEEGANFDNTVFLLNELRHVLNLK